MSADEAVPEDYRRIGFSGAFTLEVAFTGTDDELAVFERRLPDRLPFGTNGGWLGLRVNRDATPPTVVIVREDAGAICELFGLRR